MLPSLAVAGLAAASLAPSYFIYVINLTLINAIVATGLVILSGIAGLLSLGTAGLVAIGAYCAGVLVTHYGWDFGAATLVAATVAMVAGALLAAPASRLGGMHFAIVTLAFGVITVQLLGNGGALTGGMQGLTLPEPSFLGMALNSDYRKLLLILPVFCLVIAASRNFVRLKPGRALQALRDREATAAALGINPAAYKTLACAYSSFLAGLGGALYGGLTTYISPDDFTVWNSIFYFVMIVIGGMSSIAGGVIGAIVVTLLPEVMRSFKEASFAVFGVLLMLIITFVPHGLVSIYRRFAGSMSGLTSKKPP